MKYPKLYYCNVHRFLLGNSPMERQALTCPVCGAPHRKTVPSDAAQVRCSYCAATIIVPTNLPRCPNHPDILATAVCNDCGNDYCRDCLYSYEVGGNGDRGTLQLCSNCLSRRHASRAEHIVLAGIVLLFGGLLYALADPILGILFVAVFALPVFAYGIYSVRSFRSTGVLPFARTAVEKQKPYQDTQLMYQDTLAEFAKSFGVVRGTLLLENRIKAYMNDGLSKEEAIRKLAEDIDY